MTAKIEWLSVISSASPQFLEAIRDAVQAGRDWADTMWRHDIRWLEWPGTPGLALVLIRYDFAPDQCEILAEICNDAARGQWLARQTTYRIEALGIPTTIATEGYPTAESARDAVQGFAPDSSYRIVNARTGEIVISK